MIKSIKNSSNNFKDHFKNCRYCLQSIKNSDKKYPLTNELSKCFFNFTHFQVNKI